MLFSSISFLYVFLPLVLLVYYLAPKRLKNIVLLVSSLLFYFLGEPEYTALLVISSVSDYLHSLYIEKHRGTVYAKRALISSIVINLAMLGFFKYADFFISTVNALFGTGIPMLGLPLPIGISFFTFQTMSYTIDVYRGNVRAQKNLTTFATYVCLFPQLVAGPIVRYVDMERDLVSREHSFDGVSYGVVRFVTGLSKKALIANGFGELAVIITGLPQASVLSNWMAAAACTMQIYFDFSGYSDMAIGLGAMFGFKFPENFRYPLTAKSITNFWQRWHITLGSWFRDYIYIPLGGSREGRAKLAANIFIVWSVTGLWHGAQWRFVIWGLYFAVLLVIEKLFLKKLLEKLPAALSHLYTVIMIMISFVIFSEETGGSALSVIGGMFGLAGQPLFTADAVYYLKSYAVLLCIGIVGATPLIANAAKKASARFYRISAAVQPAVCAVLLIISTAYIIDESYNPFLYFRF